MVARKQALWAIRFEFLGGVSESLLLLDEEGAIWESEGLHTGWTDLHAFRQNFAAR